jgi:hypothetical protein
MLIDQGDWAATTTASRDYSSSLKPLGGWSQAVVNRLVARFGYSTDIKPAPVLDGVLLEYEVVPQS